MKEKDFNFIFEKQKYLHNSMSFNEISHKINIGENKKYFSKKLAFSTLVLSLLLLFMLTGISVYLVKEERMEYTQAVAFFKKNDLILADLTKAEIKEVYNDITTEKFENQLTKEVIINSIIDKLEEYNIDASILELSNIKNIWREWEDIVYEESKNITLRLVFDNKTEELRVRKSTSLMLKQIEEEYYDKIIGCYYDQEYKNKYDGNILETDTTLYFKTIKTGSLVLDENLVNEIKYDILNQDYFPIIESNPTGFLYGVYGETAVFIINTDNKTMKVRDINGYMFTSINEWYIYAWNNHKIYNLENFNEILNNNVLTLENLNDIYEVHTECIKYGYDKVRKFYNIEVTEKDFELVVTVDKTNILINNTIKVTASLKNLTDRDIKIKLGHAYYESIEDTFLIKSSGPKIPLDFYIGNLGGDKKEVIFKANEIITIEKEFFYDDYGKYQVGSYAHFYVNEDFATYIEIKSKVQEIIVDYEGIGGYFYGKVVYYDSLKSYKSNSINIYIDNYKYKDYTFKEVKLKRDFFENTILNFNNLYLSELNNCEEIYYALQSTSAGLEFGYYLFKTKDKTYLFYATYQESEGYNLINGYQINKVSKREMEENAIFYTNADKSDFRFMNDNSLVIYDSKNENIGLDLKKYFYGTIDIDYLKENYYVLCYKRYEAAYTKWYHIDYTSIWFVNGKELVIKLNNDVEREYIVYDSSSNQGTIVYPANTFYDIVLIPKKFKNIVEEVDDSKCRIEYHFCNQNYSSSSINIKYIE